jgi:hypothetical protein
MLLNSRNELRLPFVDEQIVCGRICTGGHFLPNAKRFLKHVGVVGSDCFHSFERA